MSQKQIQLGKSKLPDDGHTEKRRPWKISSSVPKSTAVNVPGVHLHTGKHDISLQYDFGVLKFQFLSIFNHKGSAPVQSWHALPTKNAKQSPSASLGDTSPIGNARDSMLECGTAFESDLRFSWTHVHFKKWVTDTAITQILNCYVTRTARIFLHGKTAADSTKLL